MRKNKGLSIYKINSIEWDGEEYKEMVYFAEMQLQKVIRW